jgi:hypothetical protein
MTNRPDRSTSYFERPSISMRAPGGALTIKRALVETGDGVGDGRVAVRVAVGEGFGVALAVGADVVFDGVGFAFERVVFVSFFFVLEGISRPVGSCADSAELSNTTSRLIGNEYFLIAIVASFPANAGIGTTARRSSMNSLLNAPETCLGVCAIGLNYTAVGCS